MVRTVLFFIIFIVGITINSLWVPLVALCRLFRLRKMDRRLGRFIVGYQARFYLSLFGIKVKVFGKEHFKGLSGKPLCVISNHQGLADIPVVIAWVPLLCGFIAKQELCYMPPFFAQMWYLRCVLINRKSPRSSVKAIERGVRNIKNGYPMLIFPEGTRSRGPRMNEFKQGSLKLAIRSQAVILPITINGSYKALEETGMAKAADIQVVIHEPLETKDMTKDELKDLHSRLEETIRSGLEV